MEATARIVADVDDQGRSRLTHLRGEPPLLPRRTGVRRDDRIEVHLVGGAAGPLGGDRLTLEIEVRPGAALTIRTVAASVVLPGPYPSQTQVRATVGGRLEWLPEPLIAARGCDHAALSHVDVSTGGSLVWREELIWGRYGEDGGDLRIRTLVRLGGRPLSHQELAVGPGTPGWTSPAVMGGARAVGSLLVVDPQWIQSGPPEATVRPGMARMPLAGPAMLTTAVAADGLTLRAALGGGEST